MKYYSVFAQAYGQGSYGACDYNENNTNCSTSAGGATGGNSGNNGGGLANTGLGIAVLLTLACLIVFAALIIRAWRRKPVAQEITFEETDDATQKRLSDRF